MTAKPKTTRGKSKAGKQKIRGSKARVSTDVTGQLSRFLAGWRAYALIILAGALVHGRTVLFDYVHCDDTRIIIEQHEAISGGPVSIPSTFVSSFGTLYRPMLQISWILDAWLGGTDPFIYHLSNLLYHLLASCLVLLVLTRLRFDRTASFSFALLFCLHPLLVQAVAWIPGRNDSLLAIFVLLAMVTLIRFRETGSWQPLAIHLALFAAALFTKESAALFPAVGLLYMMLIKPDTGTLNAADAGQRSPASGRKGSPSGFSKPSPIRLTGMLIAGWGAVGISWFLLRQTALAGITTPDTVGLAALQKNLPALFALAGKMAAPWKLSGLATYEVFSVAVGVLFLGLLVVLTFRSRGPGSRPAIFGLLWFALFLVPTFFFRVATADDHYEYLEHRAYLPMVGILITILALAAARRVSLSSKKAAWLLLLVAALFSVRSMVHGGTFENPAIFWETAIRHDPSRSNFHSVLGKLRYEEGRLEEAEQLFLEATRLSVLKDPMNYKNLAVVYRDMNRPDDAAGMYEKAIELGPENPTFHYFLGKLHYDAGRHDEAEKELLAAIELKPEYPEAYLVLVGVHYGRGDLEQAIRCCRTVLSLEPGHAQAPNILSMLLAEQEKGETGAEFRM